MLRWVWFTAAATAAAVFPESARLRLERQPVAEGCLCEDKALCQPVQVQHAKEVFGFDAGPQSQWGQIDWTQVTTIAWSTEPELVCMAHKHNVRLVAAAPEPNLTELGTNSTARAAYIAGIVDSVRALHIDGVSFDYEKAMAASSPERAYYVQLVNETTQALHAQVPGSQTSVCVASYPGCYGRHYDMVGLARAADLLYVMMYDMRGQATGEYVAAANSPLPAVDGDVAKFLALGVPASSLVLGVPWYGYDYECAAGTSPTSRRCPISGSTGSGGFGGLMQRVNENATATGLLWSAEESSPYYNYVSGGKVRQVWFDNVQSLRLKYAVAKKYQLRGTGPFRFNLLDYSTDVGRKQSAEMWEALRVFTSESDVA